jgi:hypothetical protein
VLAVRCRILMQDIAKDTALPAVLHTLGLQDTKLQRSCSIMTA